MLCILPPKKFIRIFITFMHNLNQMSKIFSKARSLQCRNQNSTWRKSNSPTSQILRQRGRVCSFFFRFLGPPQVRLLCPPIRFVFGLIEFCIYGIIVSRLYPIKSRATRQAAGAYGMVGRGIFRIRFSQQIDRQRVPSSPSLLTILPSGSAANRKEEV